jgi:hypothetical protein
MTTKLRQRTLNVKKRVSESFQPKYFHLYIDKDTNTPHATFTDIVPSNAKYVYQFKWTFTEMYLDLCIDNDLLLTSDMASQASQALQTSLPTKLSKSEISILKSHLQKAVRRAKTEAALATTIIMLENDPIGVLRRLPIIVVEDVCLFSDFPVLLWLMCYYSSDSKHNIPMYWKDWLLRMVQWLCEATEKDPYPVLECDPMKLSDVKSSNMSINMSNMSNKIRDLIFAMQLRRSYGGMSCDCDMITKYSWVWLLRSNNNDIKNPSSNSNYFKELDRKFPTNLIKGISELKLTRDNFILPAIDFHCYPGMVQELKDAYMSLKKEVISETKIKNVIWYCSSSLNVREPKAIDPEYMEIWDVIKDRFNLITVCKLTEMKCIH